ncbi:hypothetical protein HELRODRAFT_167995 [Helobdella robusta]|uniref:Uncharacterized protein n=1 Tax=Helobdella robusta TaxID=6412 RepID=T1F019_HELRO|nr:hypothetical protein HELRODRAFT_167995 [Helobdella robusta]ESO10136.1 hypothetical protein HELRODRAFT_167995 [Helobdella robusta]
MAGFATYNEKRFWEITNKKDSTNIYIIDGDGGNISPTSEDLLRSIEHSRPQLSTYKKEIRAANGWINLNNRTNTIHNTISDKCAHTRQHRVNFSDVITPTAKHAPSNTRNKVESSSLASSKRSSVRFKTSAHKRGDRIRKNNNETISNDTNVIKNKNLRHTSTHTASQAGPHQTRHDSNANGIFNLTNDLNSNKITNVDRDEMDESDDSDISEPPRDSYKNVDAKLKNKKWKNNNVRKIGNDKLRRQLSEAGDEDETTQQQQQQQQQQHRADRSAALHQDFNDNNNYGDDNDDYNNDFVDDNNNFVDDDNDNNDEDSNDDNCEYNGNGLAPSRGKWRTEKKVSGKLRKKFHEWAVTSVQANCKLLMLFLHLTDL